MTNTPQGEKMNWSNLPQNKCPKCGKDLTVGLKTENGLMTHPCGFKISEVKFAQLSTKIQQDQHARKISQTPRIPEEIESIEY